MATVEPAAFQQAPGRQATLRRDVVFDLLSNERRIEVIEAVDTHGVLTLSELAPEIAAIENDVPIDELTDRQEKRVYVGLYQCHLPRLEGHGVIDWDSDTGEVAPGPHLDDCTDVLDTEPEGGPLSRWLCRLGL